MAERSLRFCGHTGCTEMVRAGRYCESHDEEHRAEDARKKNAEDRNRKSAHSRGYTYKWNQYSKWFLRQPENQFCALCLDNSCAVISQCVDHIKPHSGNRDPLFWERTNHQPACMHCNSVKGDKARVGDRVFGKGT